MKEFLLCPLDCTAWFTSKAALKVHLRLEHAIHETKEMQKVKP